MKSASSIGVPLMPNSVAVGIGGGWDAYTSAQSNRVDDTLVDVLNRCKVPAPK